MHYFLAEAAKQKGDKAQQRQHLDKAIGYDPYEADVLIAMHQARADDAAFQQRAKQLVEAASRAFREQIEQQRRQLDQIGNNDVLRGQLEAFLAQSGNQYAWLVSNTFGDFQEALRFSHESLKLRPNSGAYLDTLAHCYAAVGDFENAVKYQTQAVEQEPHSSQIVRKLDYFQKELEKSKKKPSP
jgi:tetratricopeptide (TPR) repeat protein